MYTAISKKIDAFKELELSIYTALETYSNVHRGSGQFSMITSHLYEKARDIILEYLGLSNKQYYIIFSTAQRTESFIKQLKKGSYQVISSKDFGLSLGVRAIAVKRNALAKGLTFETGGGTAKLVSQDWIIWANKPDKFEAGTPAIINIIAFARALVLIKKFGKDIFHSSANEKLTLNDILYKDEFEGLSGDKLLAELRKSQIGKDVNVPTVYGARSFVNLDNSASTPTFKPIWDAFRSTLRQSGKIHKELISEVKSICAKQLGAPLLSYDIIFTSNTTEAINLAARNLNPELDTNIETVVLNTLLEHNSNDIPWRSSLIRLPVDEDGFINMKELETTLIDYNQKAIYGKKRIKLVSISGASNVLGVCNDLTEISQIVHKHGAKLLVDAAQLVAHSAINMEASGIDFLVFSAHKVYAPFGSGALVARKELITLNAEELETIRRSGEENVGGIAALGKAFLLLQAIGMDLIHENEQALASRLMQEMQKIPGIKIQGINSPEHPKYGQKLGVVVFLLNNIMANRIATELAIQGGIGVRPGCHCAHIIVKRILKISPGLEKFQRIIQTLFPKIKLPGITRLSLGIENTEKDIDRLIDILKILAQKTKGPSGKIGRETPVITKSKVRIQIKAYIKDMCLKVYS